MNWAALIPVVLKYLPTIITFVEQEAPAVQALIKDIEAAIAAANTASTTNPQVGDLLQQLLQQFKSGGLTATTGSSDGKVFTS